MQAKADSMGVVLLREELPDKTDASLAGCGSGCLILIELQPAMKAKAASMPNT
jgi:hypothetical protein